MIVLSETAKMSLKDKGVTPGVDFAFKDGIDNAVFHLTKGSKALVEKGAAVGIGAGALEFSASVDAIMDKKDNLYDWDFNFIQLLYQPVQKFLYAGITRAEGSMVLDVTEPVPQYRLDSDPRRAPFPHRDAATITALPSTITKPGDVPPNTRFANRFEDHPNAWVHMSKKNYLTGANNFLVRAQIERYFLTAFVTRDKLGRRSSDYIILVYNTWSIIHDRGITWRTGGPAMDATTMTFTAEYKAEPVKTTYPSLQLARLIERPTTNAMEMFSGINVFCMGKAVGATADNGYCTASKDWPKGELIQMIP